MIIDYQVVIDLVAECVKNAIPIGIIFGMTEKLGNLFFSLAFGNKRINL